METSHFIIVALGDSLTVGYRFGDPYALDPRVPYPAQLERMIRARPRVLGRGTQAFVVNAGINGDSTEGMLKRFEKDVALEKPDVVIVLAGVNDLGSGRRLDDILVNLHMLYAACHGIGAEPVACTLTPMNQTSHFMRELNDMIRANCAKEGITLVDLFMFLADDVGNLRPEYSDDGVHLNALGYGRLAEGVFEVLTPFFERG